MIDFEYPPRMGWCTRHASTTICKECEIDRLTAELTEARVEVERLNDKITRLMRVEQMDKQIVAQARQEAARDCLEIVKKRGCFTRFIMSDIKSKFGLEG